jgi:hypothetical protein
MSSQSQLVFWLTYSRDIKEEKKQALQFIDDYLLKKKAR